MSKIALDLSQFRSSGIYTVELDNTERITVTTQSLRLVPGFSAVGPFNTPVFIRSTRDRDRFFGPIDSKLEKRGSFFHRSIETCLLTAPVFALNLLSVNDVNNNSNTDTVEFVGLGLDCSTIDTQVRDASMYKDIYINFFNRQRFWTPDTEYLQGVVTNKYAASSIQSAPLLQIANVGTKNLSFIVRKAIGLSQYSVYAVNWYGSATNIPYEWIRPYDLMKDFFIQVIAVEGNWTNYTALSTDPYFSTYFNADGIIPSQLNNFINLSQVNLVGSWTGCIIPDFKDQTGSEQYIETVVNAATALTGILVNINNEALDQLQWNSTNWALGDGSATAPYQVDLVGHNLISKNSAKQTFLSYDISVVDSILHSTIPAALYPIGDTTYKSFAITNSSLSTYSIVSVGDLVKANSSITIPGVTYVTGKTYDGSAYIITTADAADLTGGNLTAQLPIDDPSVCTAYKFIKLNGLQLLNKHLPGFDINGAPNAEEGVKKIYGMLADEGIERGLTNPDMIQYRYIVDTMAYGLQNQMGGKSYLSSLAKKRGKTTAILNAPSIAQFSTATNPRFCETFVSGQDPVPIFSTEFIAQGGNPDMPRAFKFSFPNEDMGSKYCGVFGPFLKYSDNGKLISIPPAADVANAYVQKFLGGNPYAIIANRNGILANPNLAGVEYMIDKTDRDFLEPFGYNSIIERPSTGQVMIYCNTTAYQDVKSDFNNLHVRELLNTIELQVEEVLQQYVFDYNTPITRLNIVNSVSPILETIKDAGALTNYTITMDETNNTPDIIADGFGIIDINVWISGALTKIVNRITVNRITGATTGGFVY